MVSINEILTIGYKKAREMYLLGIKVDGKEAEKIGWVNHAVAADELDEEVQRIANLIALMPRDALAIGKAGSLLALDRLGSSEQIAGVILHSMATNIRFEPDEFNFVRERGKKGTVEAIHERDVAWDDKKSI
jgi:enoyl-CoA hydratase